MHSFKCVPRAVSSPLSQIQQKIKYINYNKPQTQKTQHTGNRLLSLFRRVCCLECSLRTGWVPDLPELYVFTDSSDWTDFRASSIKFDVPTNKFIILSHLYAEFSSDQPSAATNSACFGRSLQEFELVSVSPELAFTSSLSSFTEFSLACDGLQGKYLRLPLDKPGDVICLPAHMFEKSNVDFLIPPNFAAVVVAASACFVHAVGLWEIW